MINANHGVRGDWLRHSGEIYEYTTPVTVSEKVNDVVDQGLHNFAATQPPRRYLGASMLGHPCLRYLVYQANDITANKLDSIGIIQSPSGSYKDQPIGRMRRIWDRGHDAEARIIRHMRLGGFYIDDIDISSGTQFRFEQVEGKISGGIDGIVRAGPVDLPYPLLFEAKCLNNKSWNHVVKYGLEKSKEIYWAQIHLYMAYFNLKNSLYCVENADTCERLWLIVPYDHSTAQTISDRAVQVLTKSYANAPLPNRVAKNSDYYICRMCDRHTQCWDMTRRENR